VEVNERALPFRATFDMLTDGMTRVRKDRSPRTSVGGLVLLLTLAISAGCGTPNDPLGADIRKQLGVTKDSAEETKDSLELSYDPNVILKRAEALYMQGENIEATGEYQHFLDLHPLHQWADYAQLKLAMSYDREFTTIDRDVEPVEKALEGYQKLLTTYPNSPYVDEAKNRIAVCRQRLAGHQFYVGHFYYRQGAYPAAEFRLEQILATYPDEPVAQDSLFYLALAYREQGKVDEAANRLRDLMEKYPEGRYDERARRILAELGPKPKS
jgi:outer membrane protein assembly factor BamD